MKIFVSWSGETSKNYAKFLKEWIEQCIQSTVVFYSEDDIEKGEHWHDRLSTELQDASFGIVCLTSENINAPWIHFEAGALAKMLDSKVATLAININFAEIKGPLNSFQATKLDRDDILKLLKSINNAQDRPLEEKKLETTFNAFWPQFQDMIENTKSELAKSSKEKLTKKDEIRDSIDEILQLVRNQNVLLNDSRRNNYITFEEAQRRIDEIMDTIYDYMRMSLSRSENPEQLMEDYSILADRLTYRIPTWNDRFRHLIGRRLPVRRRRINSSDGE